MTISKKGKYQFQWGERHSMISAEYWVDGYSPSYAFGEPKTVDFIEISDNQYLYAYASIKMLAEWREFSKKLLKKKNRIAILRLSRKTRKIYWNFFNKFKKINLKKINNIDLFKLLENYFIILKYVAPHFGVSQPEGLDALFKQLQKELLRKKFLHLIYVLISPTVPDIIFKEQLELAKIAKRKVNKKILYNHAVKHAWLFFNSYDVKENLQFLKERLKEKFDYKNKILKMEQLRRRQEIIFRALKNKKIKENCLFLQKIGVERFDLKDCWAGAEYRFLPLFQEIAKRIKVNFNLMMAAYTLKDLETALLQKKILSKKQMQQRVRKFIFWKKNNQIKLIENLPRINRIIKNIKGCEDKVVSTRVIQGVSANSGKAIGRARLVQSININQVLRDLKRFNQGDILVSWMTQPNMVPIVRKSAAIIADEGGITSHAAVIAREFNIPCIVGTKNATQILKDGDLIEVDADKGIIRILKK